MIKITPQKTTDELSTTGWIPQIALFINIAGAFVCIYFLYATIRDQNWFGAILVSIPFAVVTFTFFQIRQGKIVESIFAFSSTVFVINMIGVVFVNGLRSPSIVVQFPVLLMLGITLRKKPAYIYLIGVICMVWISLIFYLDFVGFYNNQTEALDSIGIAVLFAFTIFFTIMTLHATAIHLLASQEKLEESNDEAIQEKIKAEMANKAKSTFLANMSHELRTPLNAIMGYSEMIMEEAEGDIQEDADKINISATNLLNIINSILEVSKIETGITEISIESIDISDLIQQVMIMVEPQCQQRNNSLHYAEQATSIRGLGDKQKLKQILINLIHNANKFTTDGTVTLSTKLYGDIVQISVTDTGIGIPAAELETIFEPFKQVDSEYNRAFDGAGLGLSICKEFATLMNGHITVDSAPNIGSTFSIWLPRNDRQATDQYTPTSPLTVDAHR